MTLIIHAVQTFYLFLLFLIKYESHKSKKKRKGNILNLVFYLSKIILSTTNDLV